MVATTCATTAIAAPRSAPDDRLILRFERMATTSAALGSAKASSARTTKIASITTEIQIGLLGSDETVARRINAMYWAKMSAGPVMSEARARTSAKGAFVDCD